MRREHSMRFNIMLLLFALFVAHCRAWTTSKRAHKLTTTIASTDCSRTFRPISSRLHLATDKDDNLGRETDDDDISQQVFLNKTEEKDRDLFIPIFALISLAGLFGTYAYEMIRLYTRGELFLPWG